MSFEVKAMSGGFSGQPVFQVVSTAQTYALRTWPDHPETRNKVANWIAALDCFRDSNDQIASDCPFPTIVPWSVRASKDPFLANTKHHAWTLAIWLPGIPLPQKQCSEQFRIELARLVATIHNKTSKRAVSQPSPGMRDRAFAIQAIAEEPEMRIAVPPVPGIMQTMREIDSFAKSCYRKLAQARELSVYQHWIVRDLWRENILVRTDGSFSGIVDLGASRVDRPLFDFIRLFGSMQSSLDDWKCAYHHYNAVANYTLPALEECLFLHQVSIAIAIRHWMRQLQVEPTPNPRSISRLMELNQEWHALQVLR
jgi:aminoglycoside phosphotransferase (APT) family kinase protein